MPFPAEDPLSNIGLEESPSQQEAPRGSAWDGLDEFPSATDERADQAERRIGNQFSDTEGDGSYKAKYEALVKKVGERSPTVGVKLQSTVDALRQQAADAWEYAVRQANIPPQLATVIISGKLDEQVARAELEATREAALPHVRRGTADEIAKEFSDRKSGVVVNPDEILDEDTMAGMRAKAKALAKERRDHMVTSRRENGVDRAEGAPPSSAKRSLPDGSSPSLRISYGLERGHL